MPRLPRLNIRSAGQLRARAAHLIADAAFVMTIRMTAIILGDADGW